MKLHKEFQRIGNMLAHFFAGNTWVKQKHDTAAGHTAFDSSNKTLPTLKPGQQIGLYLGSELSPDVMQYVIATCMQFSVKLTVLTFQSESDARTLLKPYQTKLNDAHIDVQLAVLGGEPPAALIQALRKRPEIALLICNEFGYLGRSLKKGIVRQEAFPVPVVLIGGNETASAKPERAAVSPVSGRVA